MRILQPGPQTTVQDLGRLGFQALGVPSCGALDPVALRLANRLVGNDEGAAALECRLIGPSFEVTGAPVRLALAGASAAIEVEVDGTTRQLPAWRAFTVPAGATVRIGGLRGSGCAVLAVAGGLDLPEVLGSRSTDMKGGFGGHQGRALRADDVIGVNGAPLDGPDLELPSPPSLEFAGTLRVVLGLQSDAFTAEGLAAFLDTPYEVSREADRMGMRLIGTRALLRPRRRHRLRRHRHRRHPGAGLRPAHHTARRSPDHRRLRQDRHRDLGGSPRWPAGCCRAPRSGSAR